MFGMMTPIDAISYSLKAGMVFGQAQTIWATRLMEMQGFWMGFPASRSDLSKALPVVAAEPLPVVTELHVEAMVAEPPLPEPVAELAPVMPVLMPEPAPEPIPQPAIEVAPVVLDEPKPEPVVEAPAPAPELALKPIPRRAAPKAKDAPNPPANPPLAG